MRPMPASPASAISPAFGPTTATPSSTRRARLRRVAGCSHMCGFIAGAISTGRSVASRTAEARSEARPPAILAMRSAVAGATTIEIGLARQPDMADVEFGRGIEQVGERPLARKRAGRQGRNEFLRRFGEDAAYGKRALLQPPDEVERFIGGDAAADDQQNASCARCRSIVRLGRRLLRRDVAALGRGAGASHRVPRRRSRRRRRLRRMVRASSSMERPFLAARRRRRFFNSSSSWRMVMLAMGMVPAE